MKMFMKRVLMANVATTRGALLALFAGLFILAACGGGGGAGGAAVGASLVAGTDDACLANAFDPNCGDAGQVARTQAISNCVVNVRLDPDYDCDSLSTAVETCLVNPYADANCQSEEVTNTFTRAGTTLALQQTAYTMFCATPANTNSPLCTLARGEVNVLERDRAISCHAAEANPNDGVTPDPICDNRAMVASFCRDNPFSTVAGCGDATHDAARIAYCLQGARGVEPACANHARIAGCVIDPFGASCTTTTGQRAMRQTYCEGLDNLSTSTLCANVVVSVCGNVGAALAADVDPFSPLCDDTYNTQREMACAQGVTPPPGADCAKTIARACAGDTPENPFSVACFSNDYAAARTRAIESCRADRVANVDDCEFVVGPRNNVGDCLNNPYDTDCSTNYSAAFETQRAERLIECITGNNAADGQGVECATATALTTGDEACISNPFSATCQARIDDAAALATTCTATPDAAGCDDLAEMTAAAAFVTQAQGLRTTYCTDEAPNNHVLCTNTGLQDDFCDPSATETYNPFATVCAGIRTSSDRLAYCNLQANTNIDDCNPDPTVICVDDLFNAGTAGPLGNIDCTSTATFPGGDALRTAACTDNSVRTANSGICDSLLVTECGGTNLFNSAVVISGAAEVYDCAGSDVGSLTGDRENAIATCFRIVASGGDAGDDRQARRDDTTGACAAVRANAEVFACVNNPFSEDCRDDNDYRLQRNAVLGSCREVDGTVSPTAHALCATQVGSNTSATVSVCSNDANGNDLFNPACPTEIFTTRKNDFCQDSSNPGNAWHSGCDSRAAGEGDVATNVTAAIVMLRRDALLDCAAGYDVSDTTLAHCARTPFAGETTTIAQCVADPFSAGCGTDALFKARQTDFCEGSAANAWVDGCDSAAAAPDEDENTPNPVRVLRENALTDCDAIDPRALYCDTEMVGDTGKTVADCVANPFATDCAAAYALFADETTRTTYCSGMAENAANSLDTNCDSFVSNATVKSARTAAINACDGVNDDAYCSDTSRTGGSLTITQCVGDIFQTECGYDFFNAQLDTACSNAATNTGSVAQALTANERTTRIWDAFCSPTAASDGMEGDDVRDARATAANACNGNLNDEAYCRIKLGGTELTVYHCTLTANLFAEGCLTEPAFNAARATDCGARPDADKWDAECDSTAGTSATFADARGGLVVACKTVPNATLPAYCATEVVDGKDLTHCADNPFDADCGGRADLVAAQRDYCTTADGVFNPACNDLTYTTQSQMDDRAAGSSVRGTVVTLCATEATQNDPRCALPYQEDGKLSITACIATPFAADCGATLNGSMTAEGVAAYDENTLLAGAAVTFCAKAENAFHINCDGNGSATPARTRICHDNGAIVRSANPDDTILNALFNDTYCSGPNRVLASKTIATARADYCGAAETSFSGNCTGALVNTNARESAVAACGGETPPAYCATAQVATGVSVADCVADPFATACPVSLFGTARTNAANVCDDSPLASVEPSCALVISDAGPTTVGDCVENPYAPECASVTSFDGVRTDRPAFCAVQGNYFNTKCDGRGANGGYAGINAVRIAFCGRGNNATTVAECARLEHATDETLSDMVNDCVENPFDTDCEGASLGIDFASLRTARANYCNGLGANVVGDALCSRAICVADGAPFNRVCVGTAYDDAKRAACVANANADDSCQGTDNIVSDYCETADGIADTDICGADAAETVYCHNNPFDTTNASITCGNLYDHIRRAACIATADTGAANALDASCGTTHISAYCTDNPFDTTNDHCTTGTAYDGARTTAIATCTDADTTNDSRFCDEIFECLGTNGDPYAQTGGDRLCDNSAFDNAFDSERATRRGTGLQGCDRDNYKDILNYENYCAGAETWLCSLNSIRNNSNVNPFAAICGTDGDGKYDDAREEHCPRNSAIANCKTVFDRVCGDNPFANTARSSLPHQCTDTSVHDYSQARIEACRDNVLRGGGAPDASACAGDSDVVSAVCSGDRAGGDANPLAAFCASAGIGDLADRQRDYCREDINDPACNDTILAYCKTDITALNRHERLFDDQLCQRGEYNYDRVGHCVDEDLPTVKNNDSLKVRNKPTSCEGEASIVRAFCDNITAQNKDTDDPLDYCDTNYLACLDDPFDTNCGANFLFEQQEVCRDHSYTTRDCANIVTNFCGTDTLADILAMTGDDRDDAINRLFDPLCMRPDYEKLKAGERDYLTNAYNDERVSLCRSGENLTGDGDKGRVNACSFTAENPAPANYISTIELFCEQGIGSRSGPNGENYTFNGDSVRLTDPLCAYSSTYAAAGAAFIKWCKDTKHSICNRTVIGDNGKGNGHDTEIGQCITLSDGAFLFPSDTVASLVPCTNPVFNDLRREAQARCAAEFPGDTIIPAGQHGAEKDNCRNIVDKVCRADGPVANPFDPLCKNRTAATIARAEGQQRRDHTQSLTEFDDIVNDTRRDFCQNRANYDKTYDTGTLEYGYLDPTYDKDCDALRTRPTATAFLRQFRRAFDEDARESLGAFDDGSDPDYNESKDGLRKTPVFTDSAITSNSQRDSRLLQGTAIGLNLQELDADGNPTGESLLDQGRNAPLTRTATFDTATYRGVAIGSFADAGSGYSVAVGFPTTVTGTGNSNRASNAASHYAGILANTDLGNPLPIPESGGTDRVNWYGYHSWNAVWGGGQDARESAGDFTLSVNLRDRSFVGFTRPRNRRANNGQPDYNNDQRVRLEGSYNTQGLIIDGKAFFRVFENANNVDHTMPQNYLGIMGQAVANTADGEGSLYGLFGDKGAIGVFVNDKDSTDTFSGGFIVRPENDPNYLLWGIDVLDNHGAEILTSSTGGGTGSPKFLIGDKAVSGDRNRLGLPTNALLISEALTLAGNYSQTLGAAGNFSQADGDVVSPGGSARHGVAFGTHGTTLDTADRALYTGLLIDTDLGAPVDSSDTAVTYIGQIGFIAADMSHPRTRHLQSNDLRLSVNFADGEITMPDAVNFPDQEITNAPSFQLNTLAFNAEGVITTGDFQFGDIDDANEGQVTGLIGERGVVGAFIGESIAWRVAGGFVATEEITTGESRNNRPANPRTTTRWASDAWRCNDYLVEGCERVIRCITAGDNCDIPDAPGTNRDAHYATPLNRLAIADSLRDTGQLPFLFKVAPLAAGSRIETSSLTPISSTGFIIGVANATDGDARGLGIGNAGAITGGNTLTLAGADENPFGDRINFPAPAASPNGVSFARIAGFGSEVIHAYYAGLLDGTDLGAAVSNTRAEGNWDGTISLISSNINNGEATFTNTFTLNINFRERTLSSAFDIAKGSVTNPRYNLINDRLALSGGYDAHGVIAGTTTYSVTDNCQEIYNAANSNVNVDCDAKSFASRGYLTGLIGSRGAIAAFVADSDGADYNYAGGFVAHPTQKIVLANKADFALWAAETSVRVGIVAEGAINIPQGALVGTGLRDGVMLDDRTSFVRGGAGTLDELNAVVDSSYDNGIYDFNFAETIVDFAGDTITFTATSGLGSVADGLSFGFRTHTNDRGTIRQSYAGLLSGTDLGAPIAGGAKANWNGLLAFKVLANAAIDNLERGYSVGVLYRRSIVLEVDYADKTIGTRNATTDLIEGVPLYSFESATAGEFDKAEFSIDGNFDADGLITGITQYKITRSGVATASLGNISGVIGADIAVAVFASRPGGSAGDTPADYAGRAGQGEYVGGFIVADTATIVPGDVDFEDWARQADPITGYVSARNSDNSGGLTVLDASNISVITLQNPRTNFIHGAFGDVNLGATGEPEREQVTIRTLNFGTSYDDTRDGNRNVYTLSHDDFRGGVSFGWRQFGGHDVRNDNLVDDLRFYAGLRDGTDLGQRITDFTQMETTWNGVLGFVSRDQAPPVDRNVDNGQHFINSYQTGIALTINFATRELDATVLVSGVVTGNSYNFVIDGRFLDYGVIYGTTSYDNLNTGASTVGTLSGLISADSAVGVFISDADNRDAGDYAGGFVVDNSADPGRLTRAARYDDWTANLSREGIPLPTGVGTLALGESNRGQAGFLGVATRDVSTPNLTVTKNELNGTDNFTQIASATGILRAIETDIVVVTDPTTNTVTSRTVTEMDSTTNLIRYAAFDHTNTAGDAADYYGAWLEADANVGVPLFRPFDRSTPATAVFDGRISGIIGGNTVASVEEFDTVGFDLCLNFNDEAFSSRGRGGSCADGQIDALDGTGTPITTLNHSIAFDGNWDELGVLSGVIRIRPEVGDVQTIDGRIKGLIGRDGALGVFHSRNRDGVDTYFAGGFTARDRVTYGDWVASIPANAPATGFLPAETALIDGAGFARSGADFKVVETANSVEAYHRILRIVPDADPTMPPTLGGGLANPDDSTVATELAAQDRVSGLVLLAAHARDDRVPYDADNYDYQRYYASSLTIGTDLGAPFPIATGTFTWNGRIAAFYGKNGTVGSPPTGPGEVGVFDQPFKLCVNAAARRFSSRPSSFGDCTANDVFFTRTGNPPNFVGRVNDDGSANAASIDTNIELSGSWDEQGKIITRFSSVIFTNAMTPADGITTPLTGLVGEGGAIGAFFGNDRALPTDAEDAFHYAGGFVAPSSGGDVFQDRVIYADWIGIFGNQSRPDFGQEVSSGTRFVRTTSTGQTDSQGNTLVNNQLDIAAPMNHTNVTTDTSLLYIRDFTGSATTEDTATTDNVHGIVLQTGTSTLPVQNQDDVVTRYYAVGITQHTDLGVPTPNESDSIAQWPGTATVLYGTDDPSGTISTYNRPLVLCINLGERQFGSRPGADVFCDRPEQAGGATAVPDAAGVNELRISGRWNNDGVITSGAVSFQPVGGRAQADTFTTSGGFGGLVGSLGAVGVFTGTTTQLQDGTRSVVSQYVGGFVAEARPPNP